MLSSETRSDKDAMDNENFGTWEERTLLKTRAHWLNSSFVLQWEGLEIDFRASFICLMILGIIYFSHCCILFSPSIVQIQSINPFYLSPQRKTLVYVYRDPCYAVMSDSLSSHGPKHPGLPCLPLSPEVCSNSYPLSRWCHPTLLFSVVPFSSCLQSFPVSGSFPMSQLFTSGCKSIGASASASILPMNVQGWLPLGLTGLISLQSKGLSKVFSNITVWKHQFFSAEPSLRSNSHISTWLLEKCRGLRWMNPPWWIQRGSQFPECTKPCPQHSSGASFWMSELHLWKRMISSNSARVHPSAVLCLVAQSCLTLCNPMD